MSSENSKFDLEDFEFLVGDAPVGGDFEDKCEYDGIRDSMLESIGPTNYIEGLLVVDLIDATFEILNLRRLIAAWKSVAAGDGIEACLERVFREDAPPGPAQELFLFEAKQKVRALSKQWRDNLDDSRTEIEDWLRTKGLSDNAIEVEIFLGSLPTLEVIEKRLFSAQRRRNDLLREISGHRELARRARMASEKVIENIPKLPAKQGQENGHNSPTGSE